VHSAQKTFRNFQPAAEDFFCSSVNFFFVSSPGDNTKVQYAATILVLMLVRQVRELRSGAQLQSGKGTGLSSIDSVGDPYV